MMRVPSYLLHVFAGIVLCDLYFWSSIMHRKISHLDTFGTNLRQSCCWMRPDLWFCKDFTSVCHSLSRFTGQATSALDSASERQVQKALDELLDQGGRTTLVSLLITCFFLEFLMFCKSLRFRMFLQVRSPLQVQFKLQYQSHWHSCS